MVVLVFNGEVVEDVLVVFVHLLDAVLDHHGHFIAERRVVTAAVRDSIEQHMAVTVLVLEAFAIQGGTPGGPADEEAPGLDITRSPDQVPHPLVTEHGVEHVERDQREVVVAVGGRGGHPGGHGAILVDALLQDLALLVLPVVHDLVPVLGHVLLALGGVDAELAEHALHTEGPCLVGDDGHHALAHALVLDQGIEQAHEGHGAGHFPVAGAVQHRLEDIQLGHLQGLAVLAPLGIETTQFLAALVHVDNFRTVRRRPVIGNVFQFVVLEGHAKAVPEILEGVLVEFLQGVGRVLGFTRRPEPITLDGMGENHRWSAVRLLRGLVVGRIDLVGVMATPVQLENVVVRQILTDLGQLRVFAEELLAGVGRALAGVILQVAVADLVHGLLHHAVLVFLEQRVPHTAPDHLDDIPVGAAEDAFQLLDDLAITPHRAVQALQVAVHHEDEIVQLFAPRLGDGAQGLGLVALAVTHKAPHLAIAHVDQLTAVQVFHDMGLVDGLDRAQAHGHGGELPVVRHQPGVGIGRQPVTVHLLAVLVQLRLVEAALQVGSGINARGRMALEVDQIAFPLFVATVEEVVEANVIEGGGGRKRGNVATELAGALIGPYHHGHGIPADQRADTPLHEQIPRHAGFITHGNGVAERRGDGVWQLGAFPAGPL